MNSFYIYNTKYFIGNKQTEASVIFCPAMDIDIYQLQEEIKLYYANFFQTEKTIIIGGDYIKDFTEKILSNKNKIFKHIPRIEGKTFYENLHILKFDLFGSLEEVKHEDLKKFKYFKSFQDSFLSNGFQNIFKERGGLVESTGSHHHYVFPSGKHSEKFLRIANILLYSSEIYFIAYGILQFLKKEEYKYIYCDTSSINSIGIALNDLRNRFSENNNILQYPINSFKSYDGLYNPDFQIKPKSLILISASTSGGIIEYLMSKQPSIKTKDIIVLFYLQNTTPSNIVLEQVLCNLTKNDKNVDGVETFLPQKKDNCVLCKNGSYAVEVSGDVFLLEKPKVNSIVIGANDMGVMSSSSFVNQFMSLNRENSILKVNYKDSDEETNKRYEIYIDYSRIIDQIEEPRFDKHKNKLNSYIDQFVPSNIKYVLHLKDESSEKLAEYVLNKIKDNYKEDKVPIKISHAIQDDFNKIDKDETGSILIIGSCISNGKNLLYLSRALRNYNLRIVYFVGINRISNNQDNRFLKTNLKYGTYGAENSTFVEIENINCSNISLKNAWQIEVDFLKKNIEQIDDNITLTFLNTRVKSIESGYSSKLKGIYSNIFLPRIIPIGKQEELRIRRNSAFYNKEDYADNVSQSDVYFNISFVINKLRNSSDNNHNLKQSTFVKNLISPENLNRFNDGIIQASILRCAKKHELNYKIDTSISAQMRDILITIFKYRNQAQGEALLEFLYALSIRKMTLKKDHLVELLEALEDESNNIIKFYCKIIKDNLD